MSSRSRVAEQRRKQQRQQEQRAQARRKQRNLLFAVVGAVVVLAAVLAVVLTQGSDDDASPAGEGTAGVAQTRRVVVTGNALARYEQNATPDPAAGATIPTVTGSNFNGAPVAITKDGKAKVVLFIAHWCPHCRAEVPLLAPDLRDNPLPSNVEMITVSTAVDASAPNYPPSKWLADANWPRPVIADDSENRAAAAYGLSAYPYFVFVDAENHVASRVTGEVTLDEFHTRVDAISGDRVSSR
jgi:cytochrome c biogenesis protein CcmG, thiol:disulfide interchange protein DsbE